MCAFGDLLLWQAILHIIFMLFFMMKMFFNWKMYKSWNSGPGGQIDWLFDTFDVMETYSSNGRNQLYKSVNFYPNKGNAHQYDGQCGWAELSAMAPAPPCQHCPQEGEVWEASPTKLVHRQGPRDWDMGGRLRWGRPEKNPDTTPGGQEVQESDFPSKGSEREQNKPKRTQFIFIFF